MQVQWTFEGCDNSIKNRCRNYWAKKQERLERILSGVPARSKKLRLTLHCHKAQVDTFEARAIMNMPGKTLAVQSSDLQHNAVLDALADKLISAGQRHKEQSADFVRQRPKEHTSALPATGIHAPLGQ